MIQMNADDKPYILDETENFAVVYKPPKIHCAPKNFSFSGEGAEGKEEPSSNTLLEWYSLQSGKKCGVELMHRLDFETHGLALFANNKKSFNFFRDMQDRGEFIKEYSAVCTKPPHSTNSGPRRGEASGTTLLDGAQAGVSGALEGFPNLNFAPQRLCGIECENISSREFPFIIESYFRPYGPGRKSVRPVIEDGKKHKEIAKDNGGFYKTEIINIEDACEGFGRIFTLRIKRGFRHQIRCHLCWAGFPIKNDPLYSSKQPENSSDGKPALPAALALRAHAVFFYDPADGKLRKYRIAPLK